MYLMGKHTSSKWWYPDWNPGLPDPQTMLSQLQCGLTSPGDSWRWEFRLGRPEILHLEQVACDADVAGPGKTLGGPLISLNTFQTLRCKSTQIIRGSCKKIQIMIQQNGAFWFFASSSWGRFCSSMGGTLSHQALMYPTPEKYIVGRGWDRSRSFQMLTFIDNLAMMWHLKLPLQITKTHLCYSPPLKGEKGRGGLSSSWSLNEDKVLCDVNGEACKTHQVHVCLEHRQQPPFPSQRVKAVWCHQL